MKIKQQIEIDLKQAMLAGEKTLVTTLRGLKSAILYAEVAAGARDDGLGEPEVIEILSKEAKKRKESADMYSAGGRAESADAEMIEKLVIEKYLPKKLSDEEVDRLVTEVIAGIDAKNMSDMGKVIGLVKDRSSGAADGATIASIVKGKLTK